MTSFSSLTTLPRTSAPHRRRIGAGATCTMTRLMPRWFERTASLAVVVTAVVAIALASAT
jgi:hypothetical protein